MRKGVVLFLALIGLVGANSAPATGNYGHFVGRFAAEFLPDGRNVKLLEPLKYIDPVGMEWEAPAGSNTDGASVPRFFWIYFPPFTGEYRIAAVIHDYYCQIRTRSWKSTHQVFYHAMRAAGVNETTAKAMYGAVYYFGPRWGIGAARQGPGGQQDLSPEQQLATFRALTAWIEAVNPDLQEVERRLDANDVPGRQP